MKKIILHLTTIAIIMLLGACSNDDTLPEINPETARTISFTAIIPEDDPDTRVSLTQQNNRNIALKWEKDDVLHFAIVPVGEGTTTQTSYTLKQADISTDGKKANFSISLSGVTTSTFKLYGVYGGEGIEIPTNGNPVAKLPANPGSATSLEDTESESIQKRKDIMLYFATEDITTTNPQISVTFQHLGSLFSVNLRNTCYNTFTNLTEVRLVGVNSDSSEIDNGA